MSAEADSAKTSCTEEHNVYGCATYLAKVFASSVSDDILLAAIKNDPHALEDNLNNILRRIQGLKNTQRSVMRLPSEILCIIFRIVQAPSPIENRSTPSTYEAAATRARVDKDWINVTYVCRRWRQVALDSSSLWSIIFIIISNAKGIQPQYFPGYVEASLQRSRNAPLIIYMRLPAKMYQQARKAVDTVLPHLHRSKELHIFGYNAGLESMLKKVKMPQLRVLAIFPPSSQSNRTIDPNLDSAVTSSTHHMAITSSQTFSKHQFGSLKQLQIHNEDFNTPQKLGSFLDALEATPLLEDILFNKTLFRVHAEGRASRAPNLKTIPNLRRLAFRDDYSAFYGHGSSSNRNSNFVTGFLAHIALPSSIALNCESHRIDDLNDMLNSPILDCSPVRDATVVVAELGHSRGHYTFIGTNIAWDIGNFTCTPESLRACAGILHAARELWVSFPCWNSYWSASNTEDQRTWLGTHNFEEIVITCSRSYIDGAQWFLFGLYEASSVHTIRIHGVASPIWESVQQLVEHRHSSHRPMLKLVFCLAKEHRFYWEDQKKLFEEWKERASELKEYVQDVEFEEFAEYPKPSLPSVCVSRDPGPWKWFDWTAVGDVKHTGD